MALAAKQPSRDATFLWSEGIGPVIAGILMGSQELFRESPSISTEGGHTQPPGDLDSSDSGTDFV